MDTFNTLVIPDSAFTDMAFVNSCLVYADKVFVSPYEAPPPDKKVIDNHLKPLSLKHGLDFDAATRKYRQVTEIRNRLQILEHAGIVQKWPLEEDIIGYNEAGDKFQELTNRVLQYPKVISDIIEATSETGAWSDDLFGVSRASSPPGQQAYPFYVLRVVQRLVAAHRSGSHIVTNKFSHYKAIGHIQRILSTQPRVVTRYSITEVIRLTVPYLVCKNLEDVLEIREKLRDYLEPFRAELCRLVADIPDDTPSEKVPTEIQRIVDRSIRPQVVELSRYLEKPQRVLAKHLVTGFQNLSLAGFTFIGCLITGVDLTAAAVATPLVHLLSAGLKTRQEISEVKYKSPFTFIVLADKNS